MQRMVIGGLALLISISAALMTLLIIVPYYPLWALAVGVGEWSLWFGLLGAVGAVLGFSSARLPGIAGMLGGAAVVLGVLAIAVSLIPLLQSLPVARDAGVRLSLGRYLFGFTQPAPPSTIRSVTYATVDGQALQLDVWQPAQAALEARPAVVVIHGGSWSSGARSDFPRWNSWLVQHGYIVFDVDYRTAPQPNWQAATGDVKCAVSWVAEHAADYGADPGRIALLGRSAGGHLALLAAYTPDSAVLPSSCDAAAATIRAVIDFYGPTDLVWGYNVTADADGNNGSPALQRFLGGTPRTVPDVYRAAAPISYAQAAQPPSLLLHGGRDQVVGLPHTERLAAALAAGNMYETVIIPYAQHGFDYNFHGWGSQIAQPAILRFLQTYLGTEQSTRP